MSASPEKKAGRDDKRRQEEQKDQRTMALYTTIGVVVVVAAIALMIWNSGLLQRNLTALEVNGTKHSAVDVQYYYTTLYSRLASQYAFMPDTSLKKQVYDEETGQTWFDYLKNEAADALATNTALAARAKAEGFTLTEESKAELDDSIAQLNKMWVGYGYTTRDAFIQASFGPYMTYDKLVSLFEIEYLASDYANAKLDAIDHPDADFQTYYQEHADSLDTIVYTQLAFRAQVPTTDAEGNPIEMTDEEKAAQLETLKGEQKALAEEVKAKLEGGAKAEDIAKEYENKLYSSALSRRELGSNVSYSSYAEWLLDSSRRAGDITLAENDTGSACYYYVAIFEDRLRDEEPTNTVRHLLVRAGTGASGETPTQEQYDEAETKARELLNQWKAGEATEDSFVQLVSDNSDDSGSASNGGLISRITSSSNYVEAFRDWAVDSARKAGDVELVKTEYGWHIMYYVESGDPVWRLDVGSSLRSADQEKLEADTVQSMNVTRGFGMNLITE
ncbi:MAG: hypothetical protein HFF52_06950 [Lawsonibacter sp.]|nr:hypothetical protein [Lawsonibacter sp.]